MDKEIKGSILYIEDEEELAEEVIADLTDCGYRVVHATRADEGYQKSQNEDFLCMIFDIHLAQGSGDSVISRIRNSVVHPNTDTPCIVVSSHLDRGLVGNLKGKIQFALVKPFKFEDLLEKIEEVIKSKAKAK